MKRTTRRERLKRAAGDRLEEYWNLLALTKGGSPAAYALLEKERTRTEGATNRELDELVQQLESRIMKRRELFGAQVPRKLVRRLRKHPQASRQFLFVPLWIMREWFSHFDERLKGYRLLPAHSRIAVDIWGRLPEGDPGEWRILEAALYEDMASHFNEAQKVGDAPEGLPDLEGRKIVKRRLACLRGAITFAFFMVEAYLNSIAFDHVVEKWDELSVPDRALLTERDPRDESRYRAVGFRKKLLSYPRIILAEEHPPIQENNCPPMAFILKEARGLRDAIVHATPRVDPEEGLSAREMDFMMLDGEKAAAVVDAAIDLVLALEAVVHGDTTRLSWMRARSDDGLFPDEAFL